MRAWQFYGAAVWVVLAFTVTLIAIVVGVTGPDPSACDTCPAVWQQQVVQP